MRFTTALLVIVSVIATHVPHVGAQSFSDVRGTGYEDAYAYLSGRGVVQGYRDGSGRPHRPINRAEALKVIVSAVDDYASRAESVRNRMPPIMAFTDVREADWFAPYVEVGFEKGITEGYPDGTFRPAGNITTEETLAMILRSYGMTGQQGFEQSSNIQNRQNQWYTPFVNASIQRNLIRSNARLALGHAVTRGQFFDILYRVDTLSRNGQAVFAGREPVALPTSQQASSRGDNAGFAINAPRQGAEIVDVPYASEQFFSISIPDAGIEDLTITHPSDPFTSEGVLAPLQNGVGHLFSYPGGGGKIMIYGHSSGYPWDVSQYTKIFRKINELQPGNRIYVTYDGSLHVYEVAYEQTVNADDTSAFNDNGQGEELILYTCWPPDSIAQRYLIHAVPVDTIALR